MGRCDTGRPLCGAPARFTAAGWRCKDHRPGAFHRTDTTTDTREEQTT
ncbi:MAG: hypothetical protein HOY79_33690 [Streptomyces sp.]|nr:hypothetical protein [Streptomyces sp.]NUS11354.1 hypothetical protein [Streptomyces sp.]NUS23505.1 hypothetical protein [Streptomyces sp.]